MLLRQRIFRSAGIVEAGDIEPWRTVRPHLHGQTQPLRRTARDRESCATEDIAAWRLATGFSGCNPQLIGGGKVGANVSRRKHEAPVGAYAKWFGDSLHGVCQIDCAAPVDVSEDDGKRPKRGGGHSRGRFHGIRIAKDGRTQSFAFRNA